MSEFAAITRVLPTTGDLVLGWEGERAYKGRIASVADGTATVALPDGQRVEAALVSLQLVGVPVPPMVVAEADFNEVLHPRNRLGKWIDKLGHDVLSVEVPTAPSLASHGIPMIVGQREGEWDDGQLKEVHDTLAAVVNRYPAITYGHRSLVGVIRTSEDSRLERSLAKSMRDPGMPMGVVTIPDMYDMWLGINDQYVSAVPHNQGWSNLCSASRESLQGCVWHEASHLLMYASGKDDPKWTMRRRALVHEQIMREHGIEFEHLELLGDYAASSPLEALAELSAMYHSPEHHAELEEIDPDLVKKAERLFNMLHETAANLHAEAAGGEV